tara:strand:- start:7792 stop:10344 length:2553 start_codon:yes stop_codon:yes gene_type:complete
MAQTKSFYDIISNHIIEVPIIQREYAQGRTTDKVTSVRKRFVDDLVDSIKTNEKLHLGFVYGKIVGKENASRKELNKEAISSILNAVKFYAENLEIKINAEIENLETTDSNNAVILKFIPLDGQQRLTTLYLLHWYLYLKGAKTNEIAWFNNFKYSNRKAPLAFCKELVKEENVKIIRSKHKKTPHTDINELIQNTSFYLKKWSKDPSVRGMLVMLRTIEKAFSYNFDFTKINIENLPFEFDFMDLDSLNQTDELYVKMNSRGKQLSDYEHFKSWLQEYYNDDNEKEWLSTFWKNIDTLWLNYFWRNMDANFSSLDNFYYNFIKNIALMHCLASNTTVPVDAFKELYGLIRNSEVYDGSKIAYISLEKFTIKWEEDEEEKSYFIFNKETLKFIEKIFQSLLFLEQDNHFKDLELDDILTAPFIDFRITDLFLKSKLFTPSLWHSVYIYTFFIFINEREFEDFSVESFKGWLRVTRNIIYNTYIQNLDNYSNALKQLNYLSNYKFNISESILSKNIKNNFFDNDQFEEEKIKLNLLKDNSWKEPIIKIENHSYFYGQINFILNFAKEEEDYSLSLFKGYCKQLYKLYDEDIRTFDKKILERFLLCQGFYLPYYKSDNIFCSSSAGGLRTRNENWRLFFKGNKIGLLKEGIDKLKEDVNRDSLENFIDDYIQNSQLAKNHWQYLFLKYPETIKYCKATAIRKFSDNDVRLLKGFPITAYHAELRTYSFFLEHKNNEATSQNRIAPSKFLPFSYFWHFEEMTTDGHPGCYLSGIKYNNKEYKLDIRYSKSDNGNFEFSFFHNTYEIENRDSEINLESIGYVYDENFKHFYKLISHNKTLNELERLTNYLKNYD